MMLTTNSAIDRSAGAQVAVDADLFTAVEQEHTAECFRLWESRTVAVIVGRSGFVDREVCVDRCLHDRVPIVRRISGGGAVLVGPGCLNYSMVLSLEWRPDLRNVPASYGSILSHVAAALDLPELTVQGTSDLTWKSRKVSGNAQRRGLRALLHHGTLLCDFDTNLMNRYLKPPSRSPSYRRGRVHTDFVTNLPVSLEAVRARLEGLWPALRDGPRGDGHV